MINVELFFFQISSHCFGTSWQSFHLWVYYLFNHVCFAVHNNLYWAATVKHWPQMSLQLEDMLSWVHKFNYEFTTKCNILCLTEMAVHMHGMDLRHPYSWALVVRWAPTKKPQTGSPKEGAHNLNPTAKCMAAKSEGNTVGRGSQSPHRGGSNTSKGQDYRQEGERLRKSLLCPW